MKLFIAILVGVAIGMGVMLTNIIFNTNHRSNAVVGQTNTTEVIEQPVAKPTSTTLEFKNLHVNPRMVTAVQDVPTQTAE